MKITSQRIETTEAGRYRVLEFDNGAKSSYRLIHCADDNPVCEYCFSQPGHTTGCTRPREKCDGCGAETVLVPAMVRGKPGCICAKCAERCKYPVKDEPETKGVFARAVQRGLAKSKAAKVEIRYACGNVAMIGDIVRIVGGGEERFRIEQIGEPSGQIGPLLCRGCWGDVCGQNGWRWPHEFALDSRHPLYEPAAGKTESAPPAPEPTPQREQDNTEPPLRIDGVPIRAMLPTGTGAYSVVSSGTWSEPEQPEDASLRYAWCGVDLANGPDATLVQLSADKFVAVSYEGFREVIEDVVDAIAPEAEVITDKLGATETRPESMLIDFNDHFHLSYAVPLTAEYAPKLEREFTEALRSYLVQTNPMVKR